jgi:dienelactone hydrolase
MTGQAERRQNGTAMAEILLFHHALGLTAGVRAFAGRLRAAGHGVHLPDLYDGRTFTRLDEGVGHAEAVGFLEIIERGRRAAAGLPAGLVYAGMSLGAMPAQALSQTRPGAKGALLLHSSVPLAEFGGTWPQGVPLQLHVMADDAWGDVEVARGIADAVPAAELFLYPGDRHLFTDESLDDYDAEAAALVMERVLGMLERVG